MLTPTEELSGSQVDPDEIMTDYIYECQNQTNQSCTCGHRACASEGREQGSPFDAEDEDNDIFALPKATSPSNGGHPGGHPGATKAGCPRTTDVANTAASNDIMSETSDEEGEETQKARRELADLKKTAEDAEQVALKAAEEAAAKALEVSEMKNKMAQNAAKRRNELEQQMKERQQAKIAALTSKAAKAEEESREQMGKYSRLLDSKISLFKDAKTSLMRMSEEVRQNIFHCQNTVSEWQAGGVLENLKQQMSEFNITAVEEQLKKVQETTSASLKLSEELKKMQKALDTTTDGASANTPLPNASPDDSAGAPLSNASHEASGASAQTLVPGESKNSVDAESDGNTGTTDGQGADEALVTTSSRKGREGASAKPPGVDAPTSAISDKEEDEDKPLKKPVVTKKRNPEDDTSSEEAEEEIEERKKRNVRKFQQQSSAQTLLKNNGFFIDPKTGKQPSRCGFPLMTRMLQNMCINAPTQELSNKAAKFLKIQIPKIVPKKWKPSKGIVKTPSKKQSLQNNTANGAFHGVTENPNPTETPEKRKQPLSVDGNEDGNPSKKAKPDPRWTHKNLLAPANQEDKVLFDLWVEFMKSKHQGNGDVHAFVKFMEQYKINAQNDVRAENTSMNRKIFDGWKETLSLFTRMTQIVDTNGTFHDIDPDLNSSRLETDIFNKWKFSSWFGVTSKKNLHEVITFILCLVHPDKIKIKNSTMDIFQKIMSHILKVARPDVHV